MPRRHRSLFFEHTQYEGMEEIRYIRSWVRMCIVFVGNAVTTVALMLLVSALGWF